MKPQTDLKISNQKEIMRLLLTKKANTRTDLASLLPFTKMTVTNLINEWIKTGYIVEKKDKADSFRGRPKVILEIGEKAPKTLGLYIEKNKVTLTLARLNGNKEDAWTEKYDASTLIAACDKLIHYAFAKYVNNTFLGIGILNESEIEIEDLVTYLKENINLEIYPMGKEKCTLFHESLFGLIQTSSDGLILEITDTIKTTLMKKGSIEEYTPNVAHLSIDYNGLTCSCGRKGCLSAYIAKPIIEKKLRDISKLRLDFAGFCQMQNKKNDNRIDWALKDMVEKLGYGITNLYVLTGIQKVILSGEAIYLPDRYIEKLEKELRQNLNCEAMRIMKTSVSKSDEPLLANDAVIYSFLN